MVNLRKIFSFRGKCLPSHDSEDWGSYLLIVTPDYLDWTNDVEQYPFVIETDGDWTVSTSITVPDGFVADATQLSTDAVDTSTGLQFTITDIGSDWTQVGVTQNIIHKGKKIKHTDAVKMQDNQGAVKGTGWFTSPAGSYPANATATGKSGYDFVAKVDKHGNLKGNASLDFNAAGLSFDSTSVDSLTVNVAQTATFSGKGKLNGTKGYTYA